MRTDWYTDFFSGLAVEFWTRAVPPEATQAEVTFLQEVLGPAPRRLLDVPCGAGRHAVALGRLGYRMTGVDLSAAFLAHARRAAAEAGVEVEWRQADMRDLPSAPTFGGAFCFGNSVGYLGRKGTCDFLAAVARALEPGAAFVLDTGITAESLLPQLEEQRWMEVGDLLFFSQAHYDCGESRLDVEYSMLQGSRRETKMAHTWVFTLAELKDMLATAGLRPGAAYASPTKDEVRLGCPRVLLVARKA